MNFKASEIYGDVHKQIQCAHRQRVTENREYLKTLVNIVITISKTNSAFRGHNEKDTSLNKGIFLETCDLVAKESERFSKLQQKIPNNAKYTCGVSQNALMKAAADCVTDTIVTEAKAAPFFAVIADETRDLSVREQLSVCIRYVFNETVNERFTGFTALKELDSAAVANAVLEQLRKVGLDTSKLIAQCFDTASVMSGTISGVQARIRESVKTQCFYVPCSAHRLKLVITHTVGCLPGAGEFFDCVSSLINFIRGSTLRHDIFVELQKSKELKVQELPKVCHHKWEYNHKALKPMTDRFDVLLETLENLSDHGRSGDEKALAGGIFRSLKKLETVFLLYVFTEIFEITTPLSKLWQSENMDLAAAINLAQQTMKVI